MKKLLIITSGLICLFLNTQAQNKNLDKIVAQLGNNIILLSELNQQYAQYLNSGNPEDDKVKCYFLQRLLTQKLLKQQAEIDSVYVEESDVDQEVDKRMRSQISRAGGQERLEQFLNRSVLQYKDEIRPEIKEQLIAYKMQQKITENVNVTPLEVKRYFETYKKDSLPDIPTEFEIGEIVLYPKLNKEEKQRAKDKIEALRLRVKAGEDFGFLAKSYSEDPGSAAEGGDLGFFDRAGMVKEFSAWSFKLKPGEMSPVFETEHGFHFLQVVERRGEQVNARHILIRPQTTPQSLERIKLQADTIYKNILDKKLPFAAAASLYSDNKDSQYNGGMLLYADEVTTRTTFIPADKVDPKVFLVVDTMHAGEVSKPVAFSSPETGKEGYKILYLKSKIAPHKGSLEQDYTKFKEKAQQEKVERSLSEWFEKRRENTYIKIDSEFTDCDELKIWNKPTTAKN
ncbi:peptidylprolyl isomerase [Pedobacter metabolipauper]|uniref:Periplasmic chaperone for outer membrane proteins SurA n=1 Tax=Pedobacter metabolipauper TaxID=425513 RepID=A0A4V3D0X4_9SPHI|nr:peptidylprolyl isomerase [Pedobacter metabolipauper]TDQ07679.1 periplasmic chaperone for outer membrane proteins SurA [Pedobacter metabolipauper]